MSMTAVKSDRLHCPHCCRPFVKEDASKHASRRNAGESGIRFSFSLSQDEKYQLVGWIMFILCALFYTAASAESGDIVANIGSVTFLVACFVFLVPLLWKEQVVTTNNDS
jgi:hypothetical protein